jgi:hypothetical protein
MTQREFNEHMIIRQETQDGWGFPVIDCNRGVLKGMSSIEFDEHMTAFVRAHKVLLDHLIEKRFTLQVPEQIVNQVRKYET